VVRPAGERVHQRTVGHAPEPDGRVVAAAGQQVSPGAEGEADHGLGMAGQGTLQRPRIGVPDLDRPVEARAGQAPAIRAPVHRPHVQVVSRQCLQRRAIAGPPQPHRLVLAAGGQALAIRAEAHGPDGTSVSGQRPLQRPIRQPPDPDRVVVAAAGERSSVPAEIDGCDALGMGEGLHELMIGKAPELHRPVHAARRDNPPIGAEGDLAGRRGVAGERVVEDGSHGRTRGSARRWLRVGAGADDRRQNEGRDALNGNARHSPRARSG